MSAAITATVLGSAQDGGLPQFGADHDIDRRVRAGKIPPRTAASIMLDTGTATLLIDPSPDLRHQWARPQLPDAIVLTHAHMGHYAGLVHFGREAASSRNTRTMCTLSMARFLESNDPWAALVSLRNVALDAGLSFSWEGHSITLLPVPHRAEFSDTVAVSVDDRLLYLPDIDGWHLWPEAREVIGRHDSAIVDGSFWSNAELPHRAPGEVPHPLIPDTMTALGGLDTDIVLTHLNHTNPVCDPLSAERRQVEDQGFTVAEDGMLITF